MWLHFDSVNLSNRETSVSLYPTKKKETNEEKTIVIKKIYF